MKHSDHNNTGFLDLLFNTLLGFVMLFFISYYLINPEQSKADIKTQAEFVITVLWPEDRQSDIDTWLEDPLGNLIWFRQKEDGLMHLDRDDLGDVNDTLILPSGKKLVLPYNQELTAIRGFIEGEWILNIHMYQMRDTGGVTAEVSIDKLNPIIERQFQKDIFLADQWQEVTVARFTMTEAGELMGWNELPKKLVNERETNVWGE